MALLAYDALGLIYYVWKNSDKQIALSSFNLKKNIKSKVGKFKLKDQKILQELDMYKTFEGKFIKN